MNYDSFENQEKQRQYITQRINVQQPGQRMQTSGNQQMLSNCQDGMSINQQNITLSQQGMPINQQAMTMNQQRIGLSQQGMAVNQQIIGINQQGMAVNQQGGHIQQQIRSQQPINSVQYSNMQQMSQTQQTQQQMRFQMPPNNLLYSENEFEYAKTILPYEVRFQNHNEPTMEGKKQMLQNYLQKQKAIERQNMSGTALSNMQQQIPVINQQQSHNAVSNSMMCGNPTVTNIIDSNQQAMSNQLPTQNLGGMPGQQVYVQKISNQNSYSVASNSGISQQPNQLTPQKNFQQSQLYANQRIMTGNGVLTLQQHNQNFMGQGVKGMNRNIQPQQTTTRVTTVSTHQNVSAQMGVQQMGTNHQSQHFMPQKSIIHSSQQQQQPTLFTPSQHNLQITQQYIISPQQHQHIISPQQQQHLQALQNQSNNQLLHSGQMPHGNSHFPVNFSTTGTLPTQQQNSPRLSHNLNTLHSQPQVNLQQPMSYGPHSAGAEVTVQPSVLQQHRQPRSIPSSQSSQFLGSPALQSTGPGSVKALTPSNKSVPSASGGPHSAAGSNISGSGVVNEQQQQQPEYKAALDELRRHHVFVKKLYDRLCIDRIPGEHQLEKSVERVIEVIEGRRIVELKLIERLIKNVKSTMAATDPSRGLIEIAKKFALYLENNDIPRPIKNIIPSFSQPFKNMEIRVPDEIIETLCQKEALMISMFEENQEKSDKIDEKLNYENFENIVVKSPDDQLMERLGFNKSIIADFDEYYD